MVRLAIHQPQYLPWLGLVDRASRCDVFVVLDNVPYSKNYFYNRNRIKTANGALWLTVPVLTKGKFGQTFVETRIQESQNWAEKHWKSLYYAYKEAPFFNEYSAGLRSLLEKRWESLADLCVESFAWLLECFGVGTRLMRASEMVLEGKKEELLISVCRRVGASHYLSGPDGRNYLDLGIWEHNSVAIDFQEYRHPTYPQLHGDFVSNMSCVDLLFNCGEQSLEMATANQPLYWRRDEG